MKPTDDDDADDVQIPTVLAQLPTDNELQLAQRVLDLERERDAFAVGSLLITTNNHDTNTPKLKQTLRPRSRSCRRDTQPTAPP